MWGILVAFTVSMSHVDVKAIAGLPVISGSKEFVLQEKEMTDQTTQMTEGVSFLFFFRSHVIFLHFRGFPTLKLGSVMIFVFLFSND